MCTLWGNNIMLHYLSSNRKITNIKAVRVLTLESSSPGRIILFLTNARISLNATCFEWDMK